MLTLHHLNNSRSHRLLWLFEELGLPYEVKRYQRHPVTMLAPPELKRIHPLGKSPVVTDGELVLAESAAIIEYIIDKYGNGRLRPIGPEERWRYMYFMHYAEGSLTPPLLVKLILDKLTEAPTPWLVRPVGMLINKGVRHAFLDAQINTHFDFVEAEIAKRPFFAGDKFSGADIQMSFPLEAAKARGILRSRPGLRAYLERVHARPAYKKAVEVGGPMDL
ncbi:MAG: glutathione S-transferase [Bdellovibrionales bacterium]|nr:glutathione S-transferase [Bdellovibrionales bacterium]